MIPVSVQGMADAEAQRLAGLEAAAIKGRKKDRRRDSDGQDGPGSMAHEAARGALEGAMAEADAGKGYAERGAHEGPGQPMPPGRVEAQDFQRPLETAGHEAPSPGHEAPRQMPAEAPSMPFPRRVDLTGSRATVTGMYPYDTGSVGR